MLVNEVTIEYKKLPHARVIKRKSDRKWYHEGGGKKIVKEYQAKPKYREIKKKSATAYRNKYPERQKANDQTLYAVRSGRLPRPDNCSKCGNNCIPVGHHQLGYEPENWFDVAWLCHKCHMELHRNARAIFS